jgi:hypothetical protein
MCERERESETMSSRSNIEMEFKGHRKTEDQSTKGWENHPVIWFMKMMNCQTG